MASTDQKETNRFSRLNTSTIPLCESETPNINGEPETIITGRLNCITCGKLSSMGVKNMETGEWNPIDKCKDCFTYGAYIPLKEQIALNENS